MNKLRGPTQIVLNITNRCNLRCLHCFNYSGEKRNDGELSDKEIMDLLSQIVRIKPWNVCFSGGEPLLRKELLFKCIEILSLNKIRTVMLTNGVLLNEKTLLDLRRLGLKEIEVSLDGANAYTHEKLRDKGSFKKIIDSLRKLKKTKFPQYEVSMVLTSFNCKGLSSVVKLLKEVKTYNLILRPMILCGRALKNKEFITPNSLQYRKVMKEINKIRKEKGIKILYLDPLSHIYVFSSGVPFFGMEIKANGDLIISPYIQLPLGNIQRHSIEDYWNKGWSTIWQLSIIKNIVSKIEGWSFEKVEAEIKKIGRIDLIDDV